MVEATQTETQSGKRFGLGNRLLRGLQTRWSYFRDFLHGLRVAWVPATSVTFGFLLYSLSLEAQDLFLESGGNWLLDISYWGIFYLAVILFWVLPVFVSARWILNRFEESPKAHRYVPQVAHWVRHYLPPLLVLICFIGVFIGQFHALRDAPKIDDDFTREFARQSRIDNRKELLAVRNDCRNSKWSYTKLSCEISAFRLGMQKEGISIADRTSRSHRGQKLTFLAILYGIIVGALFWFYLKKYAASLASEKNERTRDLILPALSHILIIFSILTAVSTGIFVFLTEAVGRYFVNERYVISGLVIVLITMLLGLLLLLRLGKRRTVARVGTICWWIGTVVLILVVPLPLYVLAVALNIITTSSLGLGHLLLLPGVTILIAYLAWLVFRPGTTGHASREGQIFLSTGKAQEISDDAMAGERVLNPLFWFLVLISISLMVAFVVIHPLIVSQFAKKAMLLPIILGLPVAMFTYLTHWSLRIRAPLVAALVLAISFLGIMIVSDDPYDVRTIESTVERAKLKPTIAQWAKANDCSLTDPGSCPAPIIVSASGGASRAAFFMVSELGKLMDVTRLSSLIGHDLTVSRAVFSLDNRRIVTTSYAGNARLWNGANGLPISVLGYHHSSGRPRVAISPNSKRIVTYKVSSGVRAALWDAVTGELINILDRDNEGYSPKSVAFSPDGQRILTTSNANSAVLWGGINGELIDTLSGHATPVKGAIFSPDGNRIFTISDDQIGKWNAETGELIDFMDGPNQKIRDISISPDGEFFVTMDNSRNGQAWLYKMPSDNPIQAIDEPGARINRVVWGPLGKTFVTTSRRRLAAALWNVTRDEKIKSLGNNIQTVKFSPDGDQFVALTYDRVVKLRASNTGEGTTPLEGHTRRVTDVNFSSDGELVVTSSSDRTARIWDTRTGKTLKILKGHSRQVNSAVFSPDGERVVTVSNDKSGRLWSVATGEPLQISIDLRPFAKQLFAISAVSGGALGATVTYAALADTQLKARATNGIGKPPCKKGEDDSDWFGSQRIGRANDRNPQKYWRDCLQVLLAGDFLSPVFISLVANDSLRIGFRGNRAEMLEQAWEERYARLTGQNTGLGFMRKAYPDNKVMRSTMARPMSELRKLVLDADGQNWLPILLLNGTSVATGRRIIASDVDTLSRRGVGDIRGGGRLFKDAYDLHELLEDSTPDSEWRSRRKKYDISLSTGATISARFPLISPPGHIRVPGGGLADRVVDGGYFENFGATTATELAAAIERLAVENGWYLKPMVILMNNDPSGFGMECVEGTGRSSAKKTGSSWFPSISAPFAAIFRTQTSRGTHAAVNLCTLLDEKNFAYLTVKQSIENLPLSWWLSKNVQKKLDEDADNSRNDRAFLAIIKALQIEQKIDFAPVPTPAAPTEPVSSQ